VSPSGRFNATNLPVQFLIRFIYEIQDFQLVGAPDWLASDRFDVAATAGRDVSPPEMRRMIRAVLADRFGLVIRNGTREMPIYTLTVVRTGIAGPFDFELSFSPDIGARAGTTDAPDVSGPSIFTAIQERLGLKLDPQRGPADVLVIDRVNQPTPD
jgi:hypothetical protein